MATFNEVWRQIQDRLSEGMEIPNWGLDQGLTGNVTRIGPVYYESIDVVGERGSKPLAVKRTDFKQVYDSSWEDYKAGRIPRHEMTRMSRKTTYIFSILHWIEQSTEAD